MKLLLLLCIIGFAAADFQQEAESAIDESVLAFLQGATSAGSLSKALGVNDPEIDQLADDLETELGRKIREALKELLEKLKDHVDNGKAVGQELLDKVKELRDKMKDLGEDKSEKIKEMLKNIREKAKEALKKILERLGLGKRNLDDSMDYVARMKFYDLIDRIKERILSDENIQKIREHIKNRFGESPILKKVKEFVETLSDSELKEIIEHLFFDFQSTGKRVLRGETWDKIKNFFKDLNIKIQDHSKKFGKWVKDMWGKGIDKLKEKHGTIKAIAMEIITQRSAAVRWLKASFSRMKGSSPKAGKSHPADKIEFIANAKDMSAEMSREALEFFRPYKDDLGTLWNKLVDVTKEVIGKF